MENIGFAKTKPFLPTAPPYSVNADMIFAAGKLRSISNTSTVLLYSEKNRAFSEILKIFAFPIIFEEFFRSLDKSFLTSYYHLNIYYEGIDPM